MTELGESGYYAEKEEVELGKGGFYSPPQEEKPPRFDVSSLKKFWWVLAIVIVAIAGFFVFNSLSSSSNSGSVFLLKVASGNSVVSGARVVALMNGIQVGAGVTGSNGIVSMALPSGNVNFEVEGSGFVSRNQTIPTSKGNGVVFLSATAPSVYTLKVVDGKGFPLVGAGVFYYFSNPSSESEVYTDSSGSASIQTLGNTVIFVRVVKSGYQSASLSVLTTQSSTPVVLTALNNSGFQLGAVTVSVSAGSGLASTGVLSVYDASSQSMISNSSLNGSQIVFNLPLGEQVFFGVSGVSGFYDYNGFVNGSFYGVSDGLSVDLNLTSIPVVYTGAWLNSFDSNNNSVASTVDVIPNPSLAGSVFSSNGSLFVPLTNSTFYAVFSAPGFVVSRSSFFWLGSVVNQTLISANSSNSQNLNVEVVDENGAPLQGVQVVVSDNGLLSTIPASTDSTGSVVFNNLPLNIFNVSATLDGLTVSKSVDLNVNSSVMLVLSVHSAFFNVNAVNALTEGGVSAVFNSFYGNNSFDSCSGFNCSLRVWGGSNEKIVASATGFLNYTESLNDVTPLSFNSLTVKLIPESAVTGMLVDFVGIKNSNGTYTTALVAGENYSFDFYLARSGAESVGLYVRIGGSGGFDGGSINAGGFSGSGVGVESGGFLSDPQPECVDLNSSYQDNAKWVELVFPSSSQDVLVPFTVQSNFSGQLQVFYRGFGLKDGFYSREPQDQFLGGNFSSPSIAECYAQTLEKDFLVIQPNVTSSNQSGTVFFNSSSYQNGDYVFYKQGVGISSASGSLNYSMQADPVMPGDVFNLSLEHDANCNILVGNFSGADSGCFTYNNSNGFVAFIASPLNKNCPVKVEGNSFIDSSGPVSSVTALLKLGATCNVNVGGYASFTVNLASIPSFYLLPQTSDWNGGPGLNYLESELQGSRVLNVNGFNFSFSSPGVQAFQWSGNGTLSVGENGLEISSQTYSSNGSSFLASGNSIIGSIQNSCSDQFCCASGWCQNSTFNSMLSFFNSSVSSLANQTVFRRGSGLPFDYFYPSSNASFYTVAQLSQGVSNGCGGKPGVFSVSLSSFNGSNWTLALNPLNLSTSLNENCNSTQLCGFISGLNGCVQSSSNSTPLTLDQLQKLTFNLVNCMYPVFHGAPVCYAYYSAFFPRIELGIITSTSSLTPGENVASKLRNSLFQASNVNFDLFKNFGQNTLDCNIPVDFPTALVTKTVSSSLCASSQTPPAPAPSQNSVPSGCSAEKTATQDSSIAKFFSTLAQGSQGNAVFNSLNSLVAVYCTSGTAVCCTPKQGSILLSVKDNQIYLMIAWGVNANCNPVFPLTSGSLSSLCNWGTSIGGALMSYMSSNGADFEMSLSSTDFAPNSPSSTPAKSSTSK